jgi:hypothetical protein
MDHILFEEGLKNQGYAMVSMSADVAVLQDDLQDDTDSLGSFIQ